MRMVCLTKHAMCKLWHVALYMVVGELAGGSLYRLLLLLLALWEFLMLATSVGRTSLLFAFFLLVL